MTERLVGDELTIEMGKQLRVLARAIYKRHGASVTIVEGLGDVPCIPITRAYEVCADPFNTTYDLWATEEAVGGRNLTKPNLGLAEVLELLDELAGVSPNGA